MAAVGRELGFCKSRSCSLKEETAKMTLNTVRRQGHPYVELREDGKRVIFFCTLCLSPCYSDSVLFHHLKGNLHKQRYAAAKVTLFGPDPWPFDDGVFFFRNFPEELKVQTVSKSQRNGFLDGNHCNLDIVISDGSAKTSDAKRNNDVRVDDCGDDDCRSPHHLDSGFAYEKISGPMDNNCQAVVHGVLLNDEISVLTIKAIGFGHIASRIRDTDVISNKVSRVWCAWFGEGDSDFMSFRESVESDFSIVTFYYTCDVGRKPILSDLSLASSSPSVELERVGSGQKKRKESFSEPEDMHSVMDTHCPSQGKYPLDVTDENVLCLQNGTSDSALTSGQFNCQLQQSRFISSKVFRRELRRQQRLAAERMCDVCQQRMLPGKDVATILNRRTGNLACSSRNTNGAFHVFHVSCLIHWLLLCEYEMMTNQSTNIENTHENTEAKVRKRRATKSSKMRRNNGHMEATRPRISSVFCPECQGTGIDIERDLLEKPTIPLSEMFLYKIKAIESHKEWMKNPESLQKCSTGLNFPCSSADNFQETLVPLKKLLFYRAVHES